MLKVDAVLSVQNVGVKCRCKYCFGGNVAVIVAVMPMYMSEKNVGDMSEICRKEK